MSVLLTQDELKDRLDYDPETGALTWRLRRVEHFKDGRQSAVKTCAIWNGKFAGKIAGTLTVDGHIHVYIDGRFYLAHRVIWCWVAGQWPVNEIDHIDCDSLNNRFWNLREATRSQNNANKHVRSDSMSGLKGVSWSKEKQRWYARALINGAQKHLGYFDEAEAAHAAYRDAADKSYGEFARSA